MSGVLITGSAGFIGTHLAEHYLKQGLNVIGLDNYLTGSLANTDYLNTEYRSQYSFTEHDVSEAWPSLLNDKNSEKIKYVFHLASPASVKNYQKFPLETLKVNSLGLQNAINFADKHKARLIFASTSEIYGSPLTSPQNENDWGLVNSFGERSCYDEAKRFGEALIYSNNKINQTHHGLVRIFNTYGPRMHENDDRVPMTFVKNALKNKDLIVFGNGLQTRSFCYIEDLIRGLVAYADSTLSTPVNLGSDYEVSVLHLAEKVLKITGTKSKIIFAELPSDDPPQRKPDLQLAKQELNYQPTIGLTEGINKLAEWLKATHSLKLRA